MNVLIGNDVVDLANPRTVGRALDTRFVARVFDAEEREAIEAEGGSDLELWSRWAAKEAAFKAISKVLGTQPAFIHRAFKVVWSAAGAEVGSGPPELTGEGTDEAVIRVGSVSHADLVADTVVRLGTGAVEAVALCARNGGSDAISTRRRVARLDDSAACWSGQLQDLMLRFSAREADSVRSLESAAVRLGAREEVARMLGVAEARVEIVCPPGPSTRRPPCVLVDGAPTHADLSLSHDGRWIAWAISVEP
ncbi:MAG: 4'-phosphopantetheinyl transferase superfamily protein [Gemmatimonadales bacterium]